MKVINLNKLRYTTLVLFYSVSFSYAADNKEVARVNDTVITHAELDQKYAEATAILGQNTPSKKDYLKEMIRRIATIDYGKSKKIDQNPIVQERIKNVIYQSVVELEARPTLEKLDITDSDAENYYKKNPAIRLSHIFIPVPLTATAEYVKEAEKEIRRIEKDEVQPKKKSFSEIAQMNAHSPEAMGGGDLGYRLKSQLDPALYQAAIKLSPGKTSEVIRSPMGYHILQVTAIRPWSDIVIAHAIHLIKTEITLAKTSEISETILNRIERTAKVKISGL